jgi:DNA/RNA-binding domain of Phe-tRNA-synthetase-like protein
MRLRVSPEVFAVAPGVRIGLVRLDGVDNRTPQPTIAGLLAREIEKAVVDGERRLSETRVAAWQDTYRRFGANPKRHSSSIERLLRRIATGGSLPPINPLVDLYNAVSLRHRLPVGGEDLAKLEGDLELVRAGRDERPVVLLGDAEAHPPRPGEVIYRDLNGAVCRRWNWKEAERTKLTTETRSGVLVVEALEAVPAADLEAALEELAHLARTHLLAHAAWAIADEQRPEIRLDGA